jgi:hypothetical protein
MNPFRTLLPAVLLLTSVEVSRAQCLNSTQWPQETITPDSTGLVTPITACNFLQEYSVITGINAGEEYGFTVGGGAYITVRQGTFDGPVLGQGYSALVVVAATYEDLFAHWNVDSTCATSSDCQATAVQLMPGCTPPTAVVTTSSDCQNNQFYVAVDIQDLGDATSVGLTWTVNGGAPNSLSGLPVGDYQIGPFMDFSIVDVTVEHAEQPACNVVDTGITSEPCVIQGCGPDNYTLCFANSATYQVTYQGDSGYPLRLQFNSGGIYQFGTDVFTVYDGLDTSAPVLYTGMGNNGDLTGLIITSTNPDHALTLRLVTDQFASCADGFSEEWDYTVGCLDCEPPIGTAGDVTTDCGAQTYTVEVEVSDLGTATSVEIANNIGAPATTIEEAGTYSAGPFPVGTAVELSLVNVESTICNMLLGTFENSFCPIQISCGGPAFEDSYCYTASDNHHWLYENTGPESLAILFSGGSIESNTWDHLTIYDGTDNTAPVLFDHNTFETINLAGLLVISTGPAIYMEMSSDPVVSCDDGFGQIEEWFWSLGCLDCEQPEAAYEVVLDCENSAFYIRTTIDSLGSDTTVMITNTGGAPEIEVTGPGAYDSGPFSLGTIVSVDVVSDENNLCSVGSLPLTNAPCPLIGCGPFQFEFCYGDQMDTTIVYQGVGTNPIALLFNSGIILGFDDHIEVYNGPDYQSPLIYSGNNGGDLSGLLFTSSNPDNALCVRFVSDFFDSCEGNGGASPWDWSVSCLDCTNPEVSFEVVEDCLHHGFNIVANVTGLGTATDLRITDSWSGDTLSGIGLGATVIGPIPVNTMAHLTVLNSTNPLCRIISEDFTWAADDCVLTACEPTQGEHCYGNNDTAWFVYQSGENIPVTLTFLAGQMPDGDEVWIYNGLDQTAQLVYAGNFGGNLAGFAISSSNPDNALAILVISDSTGSCVTGEAFPPLLWTVGCGLVGENGPAMQEAAVFPNPTEGVLYVRCPAGWEGLVRAEVLDVIGRRVIDRRFTAAGGATVSVDLGGLVSGRYAMRLSTTTGSVIMPVELVR